MAARDSLMEMLEKEARLKLRPFGMSNGIAGNGDPVHSHCYGSECMAWKATEEKAMCIECKAKGKIFTLKKKKNPKDADEHSVKPCKECNGAGFVKTGKGYCTLIPQTGGE